MYYSNQSLIEYTEYHTKFILIKYIFTNLTIYFINLNVSRETFKTRRDIHLLYECPFCLMF